MAATIEQVMTGIETRLATITGLQAYDFAPDNPTPPCAFPLVPAIPSYRETFQRGRYVIPLQVALLTGAQLDRPGQHKLAAYASQTGDNSIRAAIEGDKTLGGVAEDLVVDSFNPSGLDEVGLVGYYGGLFTVRVILRGNT